MNATIRYYQPKTLWNPLNLIKYLINSHNTIYYVEVTFHNDQSIKIPTNSREDATNLLRKLRNLNI